MADFNINHITGKQGQQGTVLAGVTTVSSTGAMRIPSGPTEQRGGRGRGLFAGGAYPSFKIDIQKIEIATTGNGVDFGDLCNKGNQAASAASSTRMVVMGIAAPAGGIGDTIQYISISSTGNAIYFGDLTVNRAQASANSDVHGGLG